MNSPASGRIAASNPAFCAVVLRAYAQGYVEHDPDGVPLSLMLVPLPVLLSGDIAITLAGTNATTGLLPWVARNPEITVGLRERVRRVADFTREAMLFGFRYRALTITSAGGVLPESAGLKKQPKFAATTDVGRALTNGRKLGHWVGQVRSPQTVLVSLGVMEMRDIGGDESYLSGHVSTVLALHRVFAAGNRPVPGVVVFDQLSRPFYSPESNPSEIVIKGSDRVDLKQYFDVLFDEVEAQKTLQVIVLEHAYFADDARYKAAVMTRWGDTTKLIPSGWPRVGASPAPPEEA